MSIKALVIDSILQSQRVKYFTTNKSHLRIRCPYCNDSIKKDSSAHLYISIEKEDIFPFFCQRCNHSGYVNKKFLNTIGIDNEGINISLSRSNKRIAEDNPRLFKKQVSFPKLSLTEALKTSIDYMRIRFNVQIGGRELTDNFKFILDVNKFLDENNFQRNEDYTDFIGFLSYDNTHLNLRNKYDGKYRYKILKILESESASKIYIKPDKINIQKHCRVFITEGVLDLFGLYEYLKYNNVNLENSLFIAVNGKGYKFIDDVLIGSGVLNCEFFYALDNDVPDSFIKEILLNTKLMKRRKYTIIRNSLPDEKDFGVPKEYIRIKNLNKIKG